MTSEHRCPRIEIEGLVSLRERHAEPASDVHLDDAVPRLVQPSGRRGGALDRSLESRQPVGEIAVADVEMDGVDAEVVFPRDPEGLVDLLGEDAELGRPIAPAVERLGSAISRARTRVDAKAHRSARIPSADPPELAEEVDIEVDRMGEEHVEIPVGDVRSRVADLLAAPSVVEGMKHLLRRAGIDPHALRRARWSERAKERERLRLPLGLQREPDAMAQPRPVERPLKGSRLLLDPDEVVDEPRRAELRGDGRRIAAGDLEAAVANLEPRPGPPRLGPGRLHAPRLPAGTADRGTGRERCS